MHISCSFAKRMKSGQDWHLSPYHVEAIYRLLMGIVYNGVTTSQGDIDVSETEARHLAIIFKNQKDYSFWKEGLTIFQEQGRDKAWEWVREKIPVLQLRNELTPKTKYEE